MASPAQAITAVSALLLVSGLIFQHTSAATGCPLLEIVSIMNGRFSFPDQYGAVVFRRQPQNIPALNQYFPHYYVENRHFIILYTQGGRDSYFGDYYQISPDQGDLSGLTMDDLAATPSCSERLVLQDDTALGQGWCNIDGKYMEYELSYDCTYGNVTILPLGTDGSLPQDYSQQTYAFTNIEKYPLPTVWLQDSEDYVSPCGV